MKTKIEYPRNGFSHHALVAKALVTTEFAKRDADLLADYGIDAAFMSEFETKIQKLKNVSTVKMDSALKVLSTETKNNARHELYECLRSVRKKFSIVFPSTNSTYQEYMKVNLLDATDSALIMEATNIVEGLKLNILQLSRVRINDELILSLQNQITDFENIVKENSALHDDADKYTQARYEAMSSVFSDLSQLCKVGKILWENENPAFYRDYILHKRKPKGDAEASPPTEDVYEELESLQ